MIFPHTEALLYHSLGLTIGQVSSNKHSMTEQDVRRRQPDPCLKAAKTFLIWPSLMKDVCCRKRKSLQIRRKWMQKVRHRRGLWHRRDESGTPKGPHLIQSTLWDHPNIAAPSPPPPGPRQLPSNLSYDIIISLFPQQTLLHTPDTHLRHSAAHTRHWHLEGFVSDLTEVACILVWLSLFSMVRVGHLNSTDTRPAWELGPRPARLGSQLEQSSRPGSASFYLHFKCVQNWNNPSLITQPAETSGPFHMRFNFFWCSILETGLLTVSDVDSFSSEIAASELLWQLSRQMGNWNTFCDDYKSNQLLNLSLH